MKTAPAALHNGEPPGAALALSRGLHYGDGVFRTLLRHGGRFVDWDLQIGKLWHDAQALELETPPASLLKDEAENLFAAAADGVLKILLWRSDGARGYPSTTRDAERLLLRYPLPDFPAAAWRAGISTVRANIVLAPQPRLAGIKHLNRLEQVLASRGWPPGVDELILFSHEGAPVCGTRSNLFWIRDGRLCTPDLHDCGVAGMMRERVLRFAVETGIEVEIARFPLDAFIDADEAFITNSLIGLWPLQSFEARAWPAPGAITQRLMRGLAHPLTQL